MQTRSHILDSDITKQISTVSLDQHFGPRATLHNFGAKFFSVDLGTSQYLYNNSRTDKGEKTETIRAYLQDERVGERLVKTVVIGMVECD